MPPFHAVQAHHLDGLGDLGLDAVPGRADHLQGELDVVVGVLARQQPEILEDRADPTAQEGDAALGDAGQVPAQNVHAPRRGALLGEDEREHGRLARTRRTDEEDELSALDVQAHIVERRAGALW